MASNNQQLLIVTCDSQLLGELQEIFAGYQLLLAASRAEALTHLQCQQLDAVLLDMELSSTPSDSGEGFAVLEAIRSFSPASKVIALTGSDDHSTAVEVIGCGAQDVFHKPVDQRVLALTVERAFHVRALEKGSEARPFQHEVQLPLAAVSSPRMEKLITVAQRVAPTDIPILLLGEKGTGKELFAEAIHRLSNRKAERFVSINCAAIPEDRIELELFGFDPATEASPLAEKKIGEIERANKGTVFLNNVCALPMRMQVKLLQFIQQRKFYRLGAVYETAVDVRIITASHQDLVQRVREQTFSEELYLQLNGVCLKLPPLKDRAGDAILMAQVYLKKFSEEFKLQRKHFSSDAIGAIETYHWPGNLRELENKVRHAVIMSSEKFITAEDLEIDPLYQSDETLQTLKEARDESERRTLLKALAETDSNISDTAHLLGVARPTVYKLLEKFQIQV